MTTETIAQHGQVIAAKRKGEYDTSDMQEFINYVLSFYGAGGLYDINASVDEVKKAIQIRLLNENLPFDGDTVDRELVRDIILEWIRSN